MHFQEEYQTLMVTLMNLIGREEEIKSEIKKGLS